MSCGPLRLSARTFSFAASTHATVQPPARNQAAADASPNGWRPISYVLTRSALRMSTQSLYSSCHACCRRAAAVRPRVLRPPARALGAVLHRDVGALQLLRDARAAHPVHDGAGNGGRP